MRGISKSRSLETSKSKLKFNFEQLLTICPADLEEVTFLLPYTSVAECRVATSIISMGFMRIIMPVKKLHEENDVFEALGESRDSAVWHRWRA